MLHFPDIYQKEQTLSSKLLVFLQFQSSDLKRTLAGGNPTWFVLWIAGSVWDGFAGEARRSQHCRSPGSTLPRSQLSRSLVLPMWVNRAITVTVPSTAFLFMRTFKAAHSGHHCGSSLLINTIRKYFKRYSAKLHSDRDSFLCLLLLYSRYHLLCKRQLCNPSPPPHYYPKTPINQKPLSKLLQIAKWWPYTKLISLTWIL